MKKLLCITFIIPFIYSAAFADGDQMKTTLVKIVNQLEAIKPLINEAKREQPNNPRTKIQFDSWVSEDGVKHNGLRQDIESIQAALINAINKSDTGPRLYQPIKGDFIGKDHV